MADGEDLNEDAVQALERNLNIIRARVMEILHRSLSKLAVIVCIDRLLEDDGKVIADLFTPEELHDLLRTFNKYRKNINNIMAGVRSTKDYSLTAMEMRIDYRIIHAMGMLYNNEKIKEFASCFFKKLTGPAKEFYNCFDQLSKVIEKKIYTSSTERRNYEKRLGKLSKNNGLHLTQIHERITTIDEIDNDLQKKITKGYQIIKQFEKLITHTKTENDREKMNVINLAEKQMAQRYIMSVERTDLLEYDADGIIEQYQKLIKDHMSHEKVMRIKRYKIETILVNWLAKYDQDMHELQKEYEYIEENFDAEKELMDDLQERFDSQEETYLILMEEKTIEEQRIFDEKFVGLMRYHSVKKIQRWWRYVLVKRSKKRRKGKKGKK